MTDQRWWSVEELASTSETVFPETLAAILAGTVAMRVPVRTWGRSRKVGT
jgi:hypothetical protein